MALSLSNLRSKSACVSIVSECGGVNMQYRHNTKLRPHISNTIEAIRLVLVNSIPGFV